MLNLCGSLHLVSAGIITDESKYRFDIFHEEAWKNFKFSGNGGQDIPREGNYICSFLNFVPQTLDLETRVLSLKKSSSFGGLDSYRLSVRSGLKESSYQMEWIPNSAGVNTYRSIHQSSDESQSTIYLRFSGQSEARAMGIELAIPSKQAVYLDFDVYASQVDSRFVAISYGMCNLTDDLTTGISDDLVHVWPNSILDHFTDVCSQNIEERDEIPSVIRPRKKKRVNTFQSTSTARPSSSSSSSVSPSSMIYLLKALSDEDAGLHDIRALIRSVFEQKRLPELKIKYQGKNILHLAVEYRREGLVHHLNSEVIESLYDKVKSVGHSTLKKNESFISDLDEAINEKDENGNTPLHLLFKALKNLDLDRRQSHKQLERAKKLLEVFALIKGLRQVEGNFSQVRLDLKNNEGVSSLELFLDLPFLYKDAISVIKTIHRLPIDQKISALKSIKEDEERIRTRLKNIKTNELPKFFNNPQTQSEMNLHLKMIEEMLNGLFQQNSEDILDSIYHVPTIPHHRSYSEDYNYIEDGSIFDSPSSEFPEDSQIRDMSSSRLEARDLFARLRPRMSEDLMGFVADDDGEILSVKESGRFSANSETYQGQSSGAGLIHFTHFHAERQDLAGFRSSTSSSPTLWQERLFELLSKKYPSLSPGVTMQLSPEEKQEISLIIQNHLITDGKVLNTVDSKERNILHYVAMTFDPELVDALSDFIFQKKSYNKIADIRVKEVGREDAKQKGSSLKDRLKPFKVLVNAKDDSGNSPAHLFFKSLIQYIPINDSSEKEGGVPSLMDIDRIADQIFKILTLSNAQFDLRNREDEIPLLLFFRSGYVPNRWRAILDSFFIRGEMKPVERSQYVTERKELFIEALQLSKKNHWNRSDRTLWTFIHNEYDEVIREIERYTDSDPKKRKATLPLNMQALDWDRGGDGPWREGFKWKVKDLSVPVEAKRNLYNLEY